MSDWSAVAVRYDRALREMRAAQEHKCEATWEFLAARDALRETLEAAVGLESSGTNNFDLPDVQHLPESVVKKH
jgi:hypothetical protein